MHRSLNTLEIYQDTLMLTILDKTSLNLPNKNWFHSHPPLHNLTIIGLPSPLVSLSYYFPVYRPDLVPSHQSNWFQVTHNSHSPKSSLSWFDLIWFDWILVLSRPAESFLFSHNYPTLASLSSLAPSWSPPLTPPPPPPPPCLTTIPPPGPKSYHMTLIWSPQHVSRHHH